MGPCSGIATPATRWGEREDAAGLFDEAPGGDVGSVVSRTQTVDERACRGRAHGPLAVLGFEARHCVRV